MVRFHFDSIAHDNDAQRHTVDAIYPLNETSSNSSPIILEGEQLVPKFNRTVPDKVLILMALYRITDKNADIVLTANIPVARADGPPANIEDIQRAKRDFDIAARSLRIIDDALFI